MSAGHPDESQRRATRGVQTLHNVINSLTWLARLNQLATDAYHDPIMQYGEVDALSKAINLLTPVVLNHAIDLLTSVVLPALQEGLIDTCDDDTHGSRGHERESNDDECPEAKRRRTCPSPPPWRKPS